MFCSKCGANTTDNDMFCRNCGSQIAASQQQATNSNQYGAAPNPNTTYAPQTPLKAAEMQYPMGWYKFLVYFALFFGAVVNLVNGIQIMTGGHYGSDYDKEIVYRVFDGLQGLDIFVGIAIIAVAAIQVYTRFRLSGFKKNAPNMLTVVYGLASAINLIYSIGVYMILEDAGAGSEAGEIVGVAITSIIVNAVILSCNLVYFKKRKSLFVN